MLTIDGSQGEGGGQILRTALALSAITGTPVRIERIRAGRAKPGLQRQHLVAVQAAARVCNGHLVGAELHSSAIELHPQQPLAGDYRFDIGSAGSTTLIVQTVLPILLHAPGPSAVRIIGGTHNPLAPPVEVVQESFLPVLHGIGANAELSLERHGFFPAGGGCVSLRTQPCTTWAPLDLCERGKDLGRHAEAVIAHLPAHVAQREAQTLKHLLHWSHAEVDEQEVASSGAGNILLVRLRHARLTTVLSACGELRKAAEQVAREAARAVQQHLASTAPVCEHLADQLLLPLALGAGGVFRTAALSSHARTNAAVIGSFLGPVVRFAEEGDGCTVTIRGRAAPAATS